MIGYGEIIAVAVILTIAIITIVILALKQVRERKAEERKEKKLRGEPIDDEEGGGSNVGKAILEYCKWSYIPLIIGYVVFLVIFSKAFDDLWKDWRGSNLFWLSHFAIILSLWLFTLKNKMGKFMAIAMSFLLLIIVGISNWPEKKTDDDTGIGTESSYGRAREMRSGVRSEKVVAYPREWIRKEVPHGYDWITTRDLKYGLENANRLLWVRIDGGTAKDEGTRKDGSVTVAVFKTPADYVEFMSGEKKPVYLDYSLMKRR